MADSFTIDVDASSLLRALDQIGDLAEAELFDAAMETGHAIQREARARLARQTSGTGQSAENLTVLSDKPSGSPFGVIVFMRPRRRPENLAQWLEFGTVHMPARPFFFDSAELEEGPHRRRIADALQRAEAQAGR